MVPDMQSDTAESTRKYLSAQSLVINVTLRCPLKCSHCCYSSDMFQGGHLSADDVELAISQAACLRTFETVHFVGGDPLLHPDILIAAIAHAAGLGLKSGITTSAYWAKSPARARKVVSSLRNVGLTELTLSYDDAHAAFVPLSFIDNAVQAARDVGLRLRVAVVVEPGSRITAASLRTALGLDGVDGVKVYQTVVNSTGRGAVSGEAARRERAGHDGAYRGPCQSVLRTFQVDHEGGVRPCCGVLPHYDGLRAGNIHNGGLQAAIAAAYADPLYKWISFAGPVEILAEVTAGDPHPVLAEEFDGGCTACDHIFRSPAMLARVRQAAEARRDHLHAVETALDALTNEAHRDPKTSP